MTTKDQPDWRESAACAQIGPEMWFSEDGVQTPNAIKICGNCDVRAQCLQFAIDNEIRHGVYGGTTAGDRRRMRGLAA
jgi:WhiB family redox-sensing transcriptional regulator